MHFPLITLLVKTNWFHVIPLIFRIQQFSSVSATSQLSNVKKTAEIVESFENDNILRLLNMKLQLVGVKD